MSKEPENVTISSISTYDFGQKIESNLREDNIAQSCYTNFKDILIISIAEEIHGILDKDGWKLKYWERGKEEKIFDAFMKNGEVKVLLEKKVGKGKYKYKKVIVKFDFSEDKKKEIAETYIYNLLEGYSYLDICIFIEMDEVNVNTVARVLSGEVYGLLTPEEIVEKFKDDIQHVIDVINNDDGDYDYD